MGEIVRILRNPGQRPLYQLEAAEDINSLPEPLLNSTGMLDDIIDTRVVREVGGWEATYAGLKVGPLVLEALTEATNTYRDRVMDEGGVLDDIEDLNWLGIQSGDELTVGNIINTRQVLGVNAWQLMYNGEGYLAAGKLAWVFDDPDDPTEVLLSVDGEITARSGILYDLDIDGSLVLGSTGIMRSGFSLGLGSRWQLEIDNGGIFSGVSAGAGLYPSLSILDGRIELWDYAVGLPAPFVISPYGIMCGTVRIKSSDAGADFNYLAVLDDLEAASTSIASAVFSGGVGIGKSLLIGLDLRVYGTTDSTSTTTGALTVSGGVGIAKDLWVGGETHTRSLRHDLREVNEGDTPYTVEATDHVIVVDTTISAITINLPAVASSQGRPLLIMDVGNAGTNNITLDPNGTETIDGAATYTMNANYQSVWLIGTGTGWRKRVI